MRTKLAISAVSAVALIGIALVLFTGQNIVGPNTGLSVLNNVVPEKTQNVTELQENLPADDNDIYAPLLSFSGKTFDCPLNEVFFGKCYSDLTPFQKANAEKLINQRKREQGAKKQGPKLFGGGGGYSGGVGSSPQSNLASPIDSAPRDSHNTAPEINNFYPENDVEVGKGKVAEFFVEATDNENDVLSIQWFVGEQKAGEGKLFMLDTNAYEPESVKVRVVVSDGRATASKEWNMSVIEPMSKPDPKAKIHSSLLPQEARVKVMSIGQGNKARVLVTVTDLNKLEEISGFIKENGGKIENQFEIGKVIVAEMDRSKLLEVAKENAVVSLWPDFTISAMLEDSVPQINVPTAWGLGYKGENVIIAVLDTGIDSQHPMLKGKVVLEKNFSSSTTVLDKDGHGTHVAGIIAGAKENNGRYDGIAPKALLYNAKVLNDNGKGDFSDVIAAINWAADPDNNPFTSDGADVINMSLGATLDYNELDPIYSTIRGAVSKGIVVVVSSGNCGKQSSDCKYSDGRDFLGVTTPGNSPEAITVGAVDKNNNHAEFSSGANIAGVGIKPDLVAPGVEITSAAPNNAYAIQRGTSMAAPHASGAIALLLNANPTLTPLQAKKLLELNAVELGEPGKDINYGSGFLNLQRIFDARPVISEENITGTIDQSQVFTRTLTITNAGAQRLMINGVTATPGMQVSLGKAALEPAESTDLNLTINGATIGIGNYAGTIQLNTNAGTKTIGVGIQTNSTTKPVVKSVNIPSIVFRGQVSDIIVEATDDSSIASVKIGITDQLGVYKEENLVLAGDGNWRKRDFGYSSDSRMAGRYRVDVTATDDAGNTTTYTTYYDLVNVQFSMPSEFITGQKSFIAFTFKNTGTLSTEATALVEIYGEQETKVAELSQTMDVQSNETKSFSLEWAPEKHGDYSLRAKFYQKQELLEDRQEKITVLVPDSLSIKEFFAPQSKAEKGKTTQFKVLVENTAESDVNAFIEVNIIANREIIDTALLDNISAKARDTTTFTIEKQAAMPARRYFAVTRLHYGNRTEDSNSIEIEAITPPVGSIETVTVPSNVVVNETNPISVVFRNNGSFPLDVEIKGVIADDENKTIGVIDFSSARLAPNTSKTFEATHEFMKMSGNYTIIIIANYEGNTAETEKTIFVADNKQPVMAGLDFEKEIRKNNPFTATITVEDDSEITSAELVVDDATRPMNKVALFANTSIFTGTFYDTTEVKQHNFSVKVCDKFQNCTSTTSQTFTVNDCTGSRVLVVSDNDYFTSSLGEDYCASQWRKKISGTPTQEYLGRFDAVIWSEGDDARNINDNEATLLNDYLASGGKLLLEGSSIAFRHRHDNFMQNIAHATLEKGLVFFATSQSNNQSSNVINVVRSHLVTKGLGYMDVNTSLAVFSDSVTPINGGVSLADWNNAQSAIIMYNNRQNNAKTLFLPFNFSALAQDKQAMLLANIMKWLTAITSTDFTIESVTTSDFIISNQNTTITVMTSNDPADVNLYVDTVQLEVTKTLANTFTASTRFTPGKHAIKAIVNPDYLAIENDYLNNELEKEVVIASEEADMAVTSILTKPQQPLPWETLQIDANIANLGGKNGDANILLSIDGNVTDFKYASIQSNSTITVSFNWVAEAGTHNIRIMVVPAEADYNNSNDEMQIKSYSCTGKKVLVVLDDDAQYTTTGSGGSVTFEEALNASGYCSSVWKESEKGTPTLQHMNSFDAVVWSSGNYWSDILDEKDKALLSAYTGNILFEGSDLGFDSNDNAFFDSITKVSFDKDLIMGTNNSALVLKTHKLLEGITTIDLNAELSPFPDSVEPTAGDMVAGWSNANAAITAYENGGAKKAYIGFSVNAIIEPRTRERLISNLLSWLAYSNKPPVINSVKTNSLVKEGEQLVVGIDVSDPNGDALTYSIDSTLFLVDGNRFTLATDYNSAGDYNFTITVSDGDLNASTDLNITILNTNRAPRIVSIATNSPVKEGEILTIDVNASDPDEETLEYKIDSQFFDANGNLFAWVTDYNSAGKYTFTVTVFDGNLTTALDVNVEIMNVNRAPRIEFATVNSPVNESETLAIDVNAIDQDGDILEYSINYAKFELDGNSFRWLTDYDSAGDYNFTITISDGALNATYDMNATVRNTNRAPQINKITSNSPVNEGEIITIDINAFDPDNDALTYSTSLPWFDTNNNILAWQADHNSAGDYNFMATVSDGDLNTSADVNITILNVNRPPKILSVTTNSPAKESEELIIDINAIDPDGDSLQYSSDSNLLSANGSQFTWKTDYNSGGDYNFTIMVTDGNLSAYIDVNATIVNVNLQPVIGLVSTNSPVAEGETLTIKVNAIDPDDEPLTYSINSPAFDANGNTFTWAADFNSSGSYTFTVSASDGNLSAAADINITINNTNRPPEIFSITSNSPIKEGEAFIIDVNASDPDNDTLGYKINSAMFEETEGKFRWMTGHESAGDYNFIITVSDGNIDVNADMNATVLNTNRPPTIQSINTNSPVYEGEQLTIDINATDPDNEKLLYYINATELTANGNLFTWQTGHESAGEYNLTVTVSDGDLNAYTDLNLQVKNTNRRPAIASVTTNSPIDENETLTIWVNAADPDNDKLEYSIGSNMFEADGNMFTWKTDFNSAGDYNFTVTVSDGNLSYAMDVNVSVLNVNRAPQILSISTNSPAREGEKITIEIDASDPDGDKLEYSISPQPPFTGEENKFTWLADYNSAGDYEFLTTVSDGNLTATKYVKIEIANVNRAPIIHSISTNSPAKEGQELIIDVNATDPDNDKLSYTISPGDFTLSGSIFKWLAGYNSAGNYSFTVTVSDGDLNSTSDINAEIINVNRPPEITGMTSNSPVKENEPLIIEASAIDHDNDKITYSIDSPLFSVEGNKFTWPTNYDSAGEHKFVVIASDGTLADSKEISVTVANINRPPTIEAKVEREVFTIDDQVVITVNASDPDNDKLEFASDIDALVFDGKNTFKMLTNPDMVGDHNIGITVSDGLQSVTKYVALKITYWPSMEPCKDTDGGLNYYEKGKADTSMGGMTGSSYEDVCLLRMETAPNNWIYTPVEECTGPLCNLQEAYCSGSSVSNITQYCELGCKSGACIKEPKVGKNSIGEAKNGTQGLGNANNAVDPGTMPATTENNAPVKHSNDPQPVAQPPATQAPVLIQETQNNAIAKASPIRPAPTIIDASRISAGADPARNANTTPGNIPPVLPANKPTPIIHASPSQSPAQTNNT